jgi:hypothetical protein
MVRQLAITAALLLAAVQPSPGRAGLPIPSQAELDKLPRLSIGAVRTYGHCLVKYRRQRAVNLLAEIPWSPAARQIANDMRERGYCSGRKNARMREWEIRGALAEGLLDSAYGAIPADPLANVAEPNDFAAKIRAAAAEPLDSGDEKTVKWRWTARCAVRMEPVLAEALFKTTPGSDKEAGIFQKLQGPLKTCIPAGGTSIAAAGMRLLLAEALLSYRAHAGKPSRSNPGGKPGEAE